MSKAKLEASMTQDEIDARLWRWVKRSLRPVIDNDPRAEYSCYWELKVPATVGDFLHFSPEAAIIAIIDQEAQDEEVLRAQEDAEVKVTFKGKKRGKRS